MLSRVQLPVASQVRHRRCLGLQTTLSCWCRMLTPTPCVQGLPALAWGTFRGFGAGSFLEKSEVTDRVIKVVKDFAKVDPSKARRRRSGSQAPVLLRQSSVRGAPMP